MNLTKLDPLLLPYLAARDEATAQAFIAALLAEHATPIMDPIIGHKLGAWQGSGLQPTDLADLKNDIVLHLLQRLQELKKNPQAAPLQDFRAYVAVLAYRGCADYFRQRYPHKWRLKNRVRYLLTHQPQFCLLPHQQNDWIGGLTEWHDSPPKILPAQHLETLRPETLPDVLQSIPDHTFRRVSAAAQVRALLQWAQQYILLDDLVLLLAQWWQVQDQQTLSINDVRAPAHIPNIAEQMETRMSLQKLWVEILQLPLRQRTALLLHLRDGQGGAALLHFPATQIAGLRDIATALAMPLPELLCLWNQLPLPDAEIATRLQLTRQQVINLRVVARARLRRKLLI